MTEQGLTSHQSLKFRTWQWMKTKHGKTVNKLQKQSRPANDKARYR